MKDLDINAEADYISTKLGSTRLAGSDQLLSSGRGAYGSWGAIS